MIGNAWADLRDSARRLRASKGIAMFAMLTLGLAMSVNVLAFTVFDAVALHTLAVREPSMLRRAVHGAQRSFTSDEVTELRGSIGAPLAGVSEPVPVNEKMMGSMTASFVLPGLFELLGMNPARGHLLVAAEPKRLPTLVMSHQLWTSRFHSDAAIAGKRLVVNGLIVRVAGVAPASFTGTGASPIVPDLWLPAEIMSRVQGSSDDESLRARVFRVLVRLNSPRQEHDVSEALSMIAQRWPTDGGSDSAASIALRPVTLVDTTDTPEFQRAAMVVLAACTLVLFAACINIALLMRARVDGRRREIAIRISLGATRARITAQLLAESVVLALGGGIVAIGVVSAVVWRGWSWLLGILARQSQLDGLTVSITPAVDLRVVLYTLGMALAAGLLSGLGAARTGARIDANAVFARGSNPQSRAKRLALRRLLVIGEVAAAIVLLVAGALIGSGRVSQIEGDGTNLLLPMLPLVAALALGAIALVLAMSGVVGLLTYSQGTRTRELGVRAALGASRSGLVWLVLRREVRAAIAGVVFGVATAMLMSHALVGTPLVGIALGAPVLVVVGALSVGMIAPMRRVAGLEPRRAMIGR